jgi:hypothetical protein
VSSVLDLHGAVIMSKHDADKLVRAIEAMPRMGESTSIVTTKLYEHFRKHDALGVLMDLQETVKPKENLEP